MNLDDQSDDWQDDVLRALGEVLVQANMFEDALVDLYRIVTGKEQNEILTAFQHFTTGPILNAVIKAHRSKFADGALFAQFTALEAELRDVLETRNRFVHASWSFDHAKQVTHRRHRPRHGKPREEETRFTVAELEDAAELIGNAAVKIWEELYDPAEIATHSNRSRKS